MHNIAAADSIFEFFPKPVQRLCGIAHTGFHFNGIDFIFRFAVVGDNEVNLNVVSFFLFIVLRIEKQPMPVGKAGAGIPLNCEKNRSGCRVDMRPAAQNRLRAGTECGIMKKTIAGEV